MSGGVEKEAREMNFEVLCPGERRDAPELARLLAWILDDLIPVPGTKFRIGLDPIVGLVPGLGDGSTTVAAAVLLIHGLRGGVPRIVLARMAVNILINAVGGSLPVAGDVFSAWFKSNKRNYRLLERHLGQGGRKSTWLDWAVVLAVLAGILAVGAGLSLVAAWMVVRLFSWLTGGHP